jgi:Contractile injection system tube protein
MPSNELISSKSGNLIKARLTSDDGVPAIEFMFNPTELTFEGVVETAENPGARTQDKGHPKVSFSHVKAYKVTINKIIFDTYEDGQDVVSKHIEPFRKAVEFVGNEQRPPIYKFIWGKQVYLQRCFVEKLTYKLTMFLPDGTPVRATIDSLTLKEADDRKPTAPVGTPSPGSSDRASNSPKNVRQNNRGRSR